jgi:hypothetical protein
MLIFMHHNKKNLQRVFSCVTRWADYVTRVYYSQIDAFFFLVMPNMQNSRDTVRSVRGCGGKVVLSGVQILRGTP